MLIALIQLAGGFVLLVWGADRLVTGASGTARNLGVAPMIIGLTIVAFGTSAPELVVSAVAAYQDKPGLAVGNAIGSNIANIGLILAAAALARPLRVESVTLKREYPLLVLIMALCAVMAADLRFSRTEGVVLICALLALVAWMIRLGMRREPGDPLAGEYAAEIPSELPTRAALGWLAVGLAALPLASHMLVEGAITIATRLNVSEETIGLTIVALGTSLPELAASVTSALRREDDLAIGNVIGSNMFNILGVIGLAATIRPVSFERSILVQDIPVMFLFTAALFFMAYGLRGPGRISRSSGALLLAGFAAWFALVWVNAAPGGAAQAA